MRTFTISAFLCFDASTLYIDCLLSDNESETSGGAISSPSEISVTTSRPASI
ncbi:MAG: hypothetical protein HKO89_02110 [Saprospiraceae bacterium]|nr:hypothetical protein [Bacteroidia bacterium]NNK89378.1 hypothetical protein [Saprospiraceae bacterium]